MRILFSLLFLFSLSFNSHAQKLTFPELRLGFTPTSLANMHGGIQFSVDKKIRPLVNYTTELAYIFYTPFQGKGFRIRPGIERMLVRGERAAITGGLHINYRLTGEYRNIISPSTNGQSTEIFYNQIRWRSMLGANASLNLMFQVGKRWTWEIGGGLGVTDYSYIEERPLGDRDRFEIRENDFFMDIDRISSPFPIFYLHLNFSYILSL